MDFTFIQDILFKDGTPEYSGYNTCLCRESGISPAPMSAVGVSTAHQYTVCTILRISRTPN